MIATSARWCAAIALVALASCDEKEKPRTEAQTAPSALTGSGQRRCIVQLHGKSEKGGPSSVKQGLVYVRPNGNAPGWDGLQWLYFPEDKYREVRNTVSAAIGRDHCAQAIVHGFSNGASAAAKLYCRGETFRNTVVGYVIDDPVTDHGVEGCKRPKGVKLRLYWTGALASAHDGWRCATSDWTCEGGTTLGVDKYARSLGVTATPSIHDEHAPYESPPEYGTWW